MSSHLALREKCAKLRARQNALCVRVMAIRDWSKFFA
jgi:hypothetical protein